MRALTPLLIRQAFGSLFEGDNLTIYLRFCGCRKKSTSSQQGVPDLKSQEGVSDLRPQEGVSDLHPQEGISDLRTHEQVSDLRRQ